MAYRNDRTERARLYKLWIEAEDKPCSICGSKINREIGHKIPYFLEPVTDEAHCQVECRQCNLSKHPFSKFRLGDRVCLNGRTPDYIWLSRHTPRRIVSIEYDPIGQCNFYTLGSNGRGETSDGQPLEGIRYYRFRSYQLIHYNPRQYGRRGYRMKPGDLRLTSNSSHLKLTSNI